ncbi:hypothetical protein KSS87_000127, partial [Heliosperma pusillum]
CPFNFPIPFLKSTPPNPYNFPFLNQLLYYLLSRSPSSTFLHHHSRPTSSNSLSSPSPSSSSVSYPGRHRHHRLLQLVIREIEEQTI